TLISRTWPLAPLLPVCCRGACDCGWLLPPPPPQAANRTASTSKAATAPHARRFGMPKTPFVRKKLSRSTPESISCRGQGQGTDVPFPPTGCQKIDKKGRRRLRWYCLGPRPARPGEDRQVWRESLCRHRFRSLQPAPKFTLPAASPRKPCKSWKPTATVASLRTRTPPCP